MSSQSRGRRGGGGIQASAPFKSSTRHSVTTPLHRSRHKRTGSDSYAPVHSDSYQAGPSRFLCCRLHQLFPWRHDALAAQPPIVWRSYAPCRLQHSPCSPSHIEGWCHGPARACLVPVQCNAGPRGPRGRPQARPSPACLGSLAGMSLWLRGLRGCLLIIGRHLVVNEAYQRYPHFGGVVASQNIANEMGLYLHVYHFQCTA